jgi:hypothetical protein
MTDLRREIEQEIDRYAFVSRVEREMLIMALLRVFERRLQEQVSRMRNHTSRN